MMKKKRETREKGWKRTLVERRTPLKNPLIDHGILLGADDKDSFCCPNP
jgi:hypothetical protein